MIANWVEVDSRSSQHGADGRISLGDSGPTAARPPFRFSLRETVDLHATDSMGVVYFGRWSRYIERAVSEYRRHLGDDPAGISGHWFMIRAFSIDYQGSGRAGDEIEVFLRCADLGRTSHTFDIRIEHCASTECLIEAKLAVVGIDGFGPSAKATPMPDDMRRRIAKFEGHE